MQSKATSVDDYFKEIPADRQVAMTELRKLCREYLNSFEEGMNY